MTRIAYKEGYKYQLSEDYTIRTGIRPTDDIIQDFYTLTKVGVLLVKKGYAWDGPSGPTVDTKNTMRGSLIHDVLYQAIGEGHLSMIWREASDFELYRICREDGMSWLRAKAWYAAVRMFGGPVAAEDDRILYAP